MVKKRPQNALKSGFGRVLGFIWEGFGTVWAVFWSLLGTLGPFFWCSKSICFKHRSKMGSKRPFGSILGRFLKALGRFWEDFRRVWRVFGWILEGYGKDFGNAWHDLALLGQNP